MHVLYCFHRLPLARTGEHQIEGLLQKPLSSIYEGNASALRVLGVVGPEGFKLRDRAAHVYSEAGRVYAFRDVCKVRGQGRRGVLH
jgi:hypothetical protein